MPVLHALQGHPEAGALWEMKINNILIIKLRFKNMTHGRSLYWGTINGKDVLICHQVDDYAVAAKDASMVEALTTRINSFVTTENKGIGE